MSDARWDDPCEYEARDGHYAYYHLWEQRRAEANERTTEQERRVKAIQRKLDRLDEAFLDPGGYRPPDSLTPSFAGARCPAPLRRGTPVARLVHAVYMDLRARQQLTAPPCASACKTQT
jgi:hypothetical protein